MADVLVITLFALASYRVTRLVTTDAITQPIIEPVRQWFEDRWIRKRAGEDSDAERTYRETETWNARTAYLLSCPWCLGFWVSGAGTLLVSLAYSLEYPVLVWLAVSTIVGFLGNADSD